MTEIALSNPLFVLGAIFLGHALQIGNGFYDPAALAWLTAAFVLGVSGTLALRHRRSTSGQLLTCGLLVAGIAWQLAALIGERPGVHLPDDVDMRPFVAGIAAEALVIGAGVVGVRALARAWFPLVLAINVMLGVWMVRASPDPTIDVVTVHREAIAALRQHKDPYAMSFQNIYGDEATNFYNPDVLVGNRVAFGFPYPPASLLLALPGETLAGDFRYSALVALVAGAAFVGFASGGLVSKLAACLFLTTPRIFYVLEQGWTEPYGVLLLAATVFLAIRRPWLLGVAGGLFIVTKQYLGLAAPLLLKAAFMRGVKPVPVLIQAVAIASCVTLPFALWHSHAFFNSVLWIQTLEPFRNDSLSYLSWAHRTGLGAHTFWWSLGAAALVVVATLLVVPNTPAGFAASVALTTFAMFSFGSKAFCNYYFFVIGALVVAAAAPPSIRGSTPTP